MFVGENDCLKIGDFGLSRTEAAIAAGVTPEDDVAVTAATAAAATAREVAAATAPTADCPPPPPPPPPMNPLEAAIVPRPRGECHTTGVGTASYASPEQLQGRQYGVRSDLFSLGLVLLELCCCFTTTHERADAFHSMRHPNGAAPAHLAARSPAIAHLAELLCRTVSNKRPSAEEVLERLDAMDGRCGCEGCPGVGGGSGSGSGGDGRGWNFGSWSNGGSGDSDEAGDIRLREELAAKTRKVEEQVCVCSWFLYFDRFRCASWD